VCESTSRGYQHSGMSSKIRRIREVKLDRLSKLQMSLVNQLLNHIRVAIRRARKGYDIWRVTRHATRLLGPQFERALRRIEIDITYSCNLTCFNCNRSCEQAPTGEHITVQQIEAFVQESIVKGIKWERIRLLGGEPTLHPQFFEILEVLIGYRSNFSSDTRIVVVTNGYGKKVQQVLARIPGGVSIQNTMKESGVQPAFRSFNIAPRDVAAYRSADFRNGCSIIDQCGFGLSPSGYYPCAVAGGIDRIFGWDIGRQNLPSDDDRMYDLLERFCSHCGHFKRSPEPPLLAPTMSKTWTEAYAAYRRSKPKPTRYAEPIKDNGLHAAFRRNRNLLTGSNQATG
jgi:uncharacterized Fe-S cluster-containing radical SAM superfamily protein